MAPPLDLPDKLYFKIGEVSRILDVPTHVLRYWEQEFHMLRPHKSQGGQRLYRRSDVELISRIKSLLRGRKFTIAGARKLLIQERFKGRGESDGKETKPSQPPQPATEEVEALRRELELLKKERQSLARARASANRRLETQRQVLSEVRKEISDLLESLDRSPLSE